MGRVKDTALSQRRIHQDVSRSGLWAAATGDAASWIAGRAKHTIYIQRIIAIVTTDAAQSVTFIDSAGTNPRIAFIPASPGIGPFSFDFGEEGIPLPEGAGLTIDVSAAGLAFHLKVDAYMRATGVMTVAEV